MSKPLGLALVVRLVAWFTISPTRLASDEDSYIAVATALSSNGLQDLFWPPVTGWLITGARTILGTDQAATLRLVWIAFDPGCLVAIGLLASRLGRVLFEDD